MGWAFGCWIYWHQGFGIKNFWRHFWLVDQLWDPLVCWLCRWLNPLIGIWLLRWIKPWDPNSTITCFEHCDWDPPLCFKWRRPLFWLCTLVPPCLHWCTRLLVLCLHLPHITKKLFPSINFPFQIFMVDSFPCQSSQTQHWCYCLTFFILYFFITITTKCIQ